MVEVHPNDLNTGTCILSAGGFQNLAYLYRDRFSLISFVVVSLFLTLIIGFSNQMSQPDTITSITAARYSADGEKTIVNQTTFANLGFTEDFLEFDVVYANTDFLRRQRYLTVGPTYTDYVQVKHFDAWNNQIKIEWKGDRTLHSPTKRCH